MKTSLPIALLILAWPAGLACALDLSTVQPMPASHREFLLSDAVKTFPPLPPRNTDNFTPAPVFYGPEPGPMPGLTVTIESAPFIRAHGHPGVIRMPVTITLTSQLPCYVYFPEPPIAHLWLYSVRTVGNQPADAGMSYVQINLSKPKEWSSRGTWLQPGRTCTLVADRVITLNSKMDTRLVAEVTVDALLPKNAMMLLHTFSVSYPIPYGKGQSVAQSTH